MAGSGHALTRSFFVVVIILWPSVADPGCLSRIPDPDFYPSRISDLGSRIQKQQQKRGMKNFFFFIPFYIATNFTKLNIILVLKRRRQKFWPIFKEIKNFLPKKFSLLSKILVWDPGSEIRDP